jgi:plasmid maintenance system killer protein
LEVFIDDKELEKLYETGTSRKLKLRPEIINKFFATIQKIEAAHDIYDLWKDPSLNFKNYKDHYSMRLSGKYRLHASVVWLNEDKTIGEFHLFEISNHYGD